MSSGAMTAYSRRNAAVASADPAKPRAGKVVVTMLVFSFLLEPKLFVKFSALNYLYILGAVLVFCYAAYRAFSRNMVLSNAIWAALLYRTALFFPTVLSGGEILDWGYYSMTLLSLLALFETVRDEEELRGYIRAVSYTLLLYLMLNLATIVIWPDGVRDELFFLGLRTRITEVALVAFAATVYLDYVEGKRLSLRTAAIVSVAVAQFVIEWVATALVGVAVLAFCLVLFRFLDVKRYSGLFKAVFVIGLVLSVAICFYHAQYLFRDFIEDVLHKSVTLSSREEIWNEGISLFFQSPLFGYGIVDNGNHIQLVQPWAVESWQAHNNLLQILLDGGVVAALFFYAFVWSVGTSLGRSAGSYPRGAVILAVWTSYNVMSIAEIFVLQNYFFLFLAMASAIARVGLTRSQGEGGREGAAR